MIDFVLLSHPRSGSSALRHEINRYPSVVIPPEASFATWLTRSPTLLKAEKAEGILKRDAFANSFADALLGTRKIEHWGLSRGEVVQRLGTTGANTCKAAISEVYGLYRDSVRPKALSIGDKNNSYFFEVAAALRVLAPKKVVVLWRDPVEVWSSYRLLEHDATVKPPLRISPYFPPLPNGVDEFVESWNRGYQRALQCLDVWGGPVLYCSYRALLQDSKHLVKGIVKFVTGTSVPVPEDVPEQLHEPEEFSPWKAAVGSPVSKFASRARFDSVEPQIASEILARTAATRAKLWAREQSCGSWV